MVDWTTLQPWVVKESQGHVDQQGHQVWMEHQELKECLEGRALQEIVVIQATEEYKDSQANLVLMAHLDQMEKMELMVLPAKLDRQDHQVHLGTLGQWVPKGHLVLQEQKEQGDLQV